MSPRSSSGYWAEIRLGNPCVQCARFGICEVRLLSNTAARTYIPRQTRLLQAWLDRSATGKVRIFFPALGMLATTRALFFHGNVFRIEAPLDLPAPLAHRLGLRRCTLPAGRYTCRETARGFWIEFPVQPEEAGAEPAIAEYDLN